MQVRMRSPDSLHDRRAIYLNGVEYRQRSLVGVRRIDRTSSGDIPVSVKLTITCPDAPFTQIIRVNSPFAGHIADLPHHQIAVWKTKCDFIRAGVVDRAFRLQLLPGHDWSFRAK
jgi:hypothetical protein